jgi:butyrate kinase
MSYKILVINPGSTSTKIGVYEDETQLFEKTLRHPTEEIAKYASIVDQKDFRMNMILDMLKENQFDVKTLDVVVGRGGLLKPIPGGTYAVSDELLKDLIAGVQGEHASNLGGILAREIGDSIGVPSYIVDPVVVDELGDVARLSGVPELPRISIFHALNQKAVAKRYAKEHGVPYESLNLVIAHMGGGCSVGAHAAGKVIDVNNTLDGDGPFSPERSGGVPAGALIKLCFSGKYSEQEVYKKINGKGGMNAYLGTNDMRDVQKKAFEEGDAQAKLVFDAFTYQVAKDIGSMAAVLKGKVDQIILTGGISYSPAVVDAIKERVEFISGVTVYPGEDELLALTQGALRVLNGEEEAKVY